MLLTGTVATAAAISVGAVVSQFPFAWEWMSSTVLMWLAMGGAVIFAFLRGRPAGLLSFCPSDLLWGLAMGLALRGLQGVIGRANDLPFPAASGSGSGLSTEWWLAVALPAGVVAPVLEEAFFRGLALVSIYQILRGSVGSLAAGATALLGSSGAFVLLHATSGALPLADGMQLFIVGGTCALLVLLTGRIWGAILSHVIYNASYLGLVVAGTLLA